MQFLSSKSLLIISYFGDNWTKHDKNDDRKSAKLHNKIWKTGFLENHKI